MEIYQTYHEIYIIIHYMIIINMIYDTYYKYDLFDFYDKYKSHTLYDL